MWPRLIPRTRKRRILLGIVVAGVSIAAVLGYRPARFAWEMSRGRDALKTYDTDEALARFQRAAELRPDSGEAEFYLARTFRKRGDLVRFEPHLKKARELGFSHKRLIRERWLLAAQTGRMSLAEQHLPELLKDPGGDGEEILLAYAAGYLRTVQTTKALLMLGLWKKDFPDDPRPHYYEGQVYVQTRDDRAAECFRSALELKSDYFKARLELAHCLRRLNKVTEAEQEYRRCLEAEPDNVEAQVGLAECLIREVKHGEAEPILKQVLQADPHNVPARVALAKIANFQHKPAEAVKYLEPCVKDRPRDITVRSAMGNALRQLKRNTEAQQHLDFVKKATKARDRVAQLRLRLNHNPNDVEARYEIGTILMDYGSPTEAVMWLEGVLDIDPNHAAARRALAKYHKEVAGTKTPDGK